MNFKIFLIIPTLKQGGAERVMSELANEFARRGHDVYLVLLANAETFYELDKSITVLNLGFENKGVISRFFAQIEIYFKLKCGLREHHPNFTLTFMTKYSVLTLMAAYGLNIPVFVSDRSNPRKNIGPMLSLARKIFYKNATGIVAQTQLAKDILYKDTGNSNIEVISNPIRKIIPYPNVERKRIILNVGRMVPEKGQIYLLEAFAKIEDKSWTLVILGDGPLREQLCNYAQELGISNRLSMPGSVSNIDEWFARSSIFAFSSISEGFPNALAEAMCAGLPCVSFDCDSGPRDLINHMVNGLLVKVGDLELFYESLKCLINDNNLSQQLGEEARKISKTLDTIEIASKYLNFCSNRPR